MKRALVFIGLGSTLLAGTAWWLLPRTSEPTNEPRYTAPATPAAEPGTDDESLPVATVVAENLTIPWEVVFLPDGELLVTERPGRLLLLKRGLDIEVPGVEHVGEGGLLGAALHPNFAENALLYLYQTTRTDAGLVNRVVRYTLEDDTLTYERDILADLPGAWYHDGGRIAFGPDGMLYVAVGDATDPDTAQDASTYAGAILRATPEGDVPNDNPTEGSLVYSYGHRNPQGLAWDEAGNLWSSEHGRSVGASGYDEINRIIPGANYGWPQSEGDTVLPNTVAPTRHSTADVTWAPGGLAYHDGSLYMTGLRGETLYEALLDGDEIVDWRKHFVGEFGRLRTVQVGPDNMLYLTTSNRDGRGDTPAQNDDHIIRIDPTQL